MTTTNNNGNAFDAIVKRASNTFNVDASYRTNTLSNIAGGVSVKVGYADGSARIYDKVKSPKAYINRILNSIDSSVVSAVVVDEVEVFEWS